MPSKHKALNSHSSTALRKKERKEGRKEGRKKEGKQRNINWFMISEVSVHV
jgi:hypothetical protein